MRRSPPARRGRSRTRTTRPRTVPTPSNWSRPTAPAPSPATPPSSVDSSWRSTRPAGPDRQWCALGSVKSQIGHTKAAAGAAGLFKVVMALHHKVLPQTAKIDEPNPELHLASSPFHLNTRTRPWVRGSDHERRGIGQFVRLRWIELPRRSVGVQRRHATRAPRLRTADCRAGDPVRGRRRRRRRAGPSASSTRPRLAGYLRFARADEPAGVHRRRSGTARRHRHGRSRPARQARAGGRPRSRATRTRRSRCRPACTTASARATATWRSSFPARAASTCSWAPTWR